MRDGRWQYKVETFKQSVWSYKPKDVDGQISERLNRMGMEGWELVCPISITGNNILYTFHSNKSSLWTPKCTTCNNCNLISTSFPLFNQ